MLFCFTKNPIRYSQLIRLSFTAAIIGLTLCPNFCSAQRVRNSVSPQQVPSWQLQQPQPTVQTSPNVSNLRQTKPRAYYLDSGDVLGIFLEGVLGEVDGTPPVHYPPAGSSIGPSMGFPIVVRENGTLSLPLVDPIPVRGLTIQQAEELVKSVYLGNNASGKKILNATSRIIVTLQRKRTVNVIVIRQDNSRSMGIGRNNRGAVSERSDRSARSASIQLPAYENDVLHALIETGGLPGVNSSGEVRVYRSSPSSVATNSTVRNPVFPVSGIRSSEFPRTGYSPNGIRYTTNSNLATTNIPLNQTSSGGQFDNRNSILTQGDIVLVESRPTEVYYTSGLLRGGEHLLPRDKTLNVLEAVALAGGPITNNGTANRLVPTELFIIRNNGANGRVNIRVDLQQALTDPTHQVLIAPGDHLILQHKPIQRIGNYGIRAINNYGLRRLIQ